jgi:hypothetical protein
MHPDRRTLQEAIIAAVSGDFVRRNRELGDHNPLVTEFVKISEMIEGALAGVSMGDQIVPKATYDAFSDAGRR